MKKTKGKFIVIDGIDGSGKGIQAKLLTGFLFDQDKKKHIFLTREPFNSEYYEEIRDILRKNKDPKDNAEVLTDLFVKDRLYHIQIIEQMLKQGINVVSDRYKYSTLAYQQTQGIPLKKLIGMHQGLLVPDLAIILDVPVDVALQRIVKDKNRDYKEVFEEKIFQEELRENFLFLPSFLPNEKIVMINGNQLVMDVFKIIKAEVNKLFEEGR